MNSSKQLAKHIRELFFGGNWTASNVKNQIQEINWKKASEQRANHNSIVTLSHHMAYYITSISDVLKGKPLESKDELSFVHNIDTEDKWNMFLDQVWLDVEELAKLIEQLPEDKLFESFVDEKYGIYFRNILGFIEHTHYHLGQIALLKRMQ
ncbi:MAG: DUF1572 domain-containing protein [Flavobacteriales bacterium]|nr:DUF1572 domain-containing protein [Flavobacteriales bacterium]